MSLNKLLRIFCYTVAVVVSLIIALFLFSEFFISSGFRRWIAETLYRILDDKDLRNLGEKVCDVVLLIIAAFLFSKIFFGSGFSRWLTNTLLRVFPDRH
ncbi:MAG: hypothetical protein C0507_17645 [Cyanobacteria bacterium PR.3.49]|nr:hypothetical protein [Cyanobacteria bacterium PR.3.49]